MRVTVLGGGPVGLTFAHLLKSALGSAVRIRVYDGRWSELGGRVVWRTKEQGNARRQQVVTIQSRQYLSWSDAIRRRLFAPGQYSEMWPTGPDSIDGLPPRNVRIAHIEDVLLAMADERGDIELVPRRFDIKAEEHRLAGEDVVAICEGQRSATRDHYRNQFGAASNEPYSLDGEGPLTDVVLGIRGRSSLPDPLAVVLTIAQNRFLLNSLDGEGFLNMRLTDAEAAEVIGINLETQEFRPCIQASPCLMQADASSGRFTCGTHGSVFLPAMLRDSALWERAREGLALFGMDEAEVSAITAFKLSMNHQPRFSTEIRPAGSGGQPTRAFLLGDAANAIHFWPGRGLNTGLASAVSLARTLARAPLARRPFRDADFSRHEGAMAMLQYRNKTRGWRAMVHDAEDGGQVAIKDVVADAIVDLASASGAEAASDGERSHSLFARFQEARGLLEGRLRDLPTDEALWERVTALNPAAIQVLLASGAWNTPAAGGEEVDLDELLEPLDVEGPGAGADRQPTMLSLVPGDGSSSGPDRVARPAPRFQLVLHRATAPDEPDQIFDVPVGASVVRIGRDPVWADIVLDDRGVSRRHAQLCVEPAGLSVSDQRSTAGTYLNGARLDGEALSPVAGGDRIALGPGVALHVTDRRPAVTGVAAS